MDSKTVRLNKFLAERLGISRRQADDAIAADKVTVNGETATLGARININSIDKIDEVCYNGDKVGGAVSYIYLAVNKPVGYLCSKRSQGDFPTIYELLPKEYQKLKTVGRLDRDSSGLILLTNDGDFAFQATHPQFQKTKVYEVELDRALEPLHQQEISDFGIEIGDGVSKLGLTRMDDSRKKWQVTMSEGRNRQIRRTFAALGYEVVKLHRIQFGKYQLAGLKPGKFEVVDKIN